MSEAVVAAPAANAVDTQNPADPKQAQAAATAANAVTSETAKSAAAEAMRKHRLKVDGQEIEVDDEELKRGYSHQRAANKILQEGKAAKKQAEEFVKMMKDKGTLFDAIQKLGHDPRKLAEEYLAAQLEDEMLDPRDKELKSAKARLQQYEELEKRQKQELESKRDAEMKAKFSEEYTKQFTDALKESNLPATKETVAEMAKYISRSAKIGFQMTAQEAAKLVTEDIEERQRRLYSSADAETLIRLLGDQGLQKIRTYDTSRLKDPNANLVTPKEQGEIRPRTRSTAKRMTPQEWRELNRK